MLRLSPVIRTTLLVVAFFAMGAGRSLAAPITEFFGPPDFVWFHPSGGATPNHIWVSGDYWDENFASTPLPSAGSLQLHLVYDDNTLAQTLNLNVLVNSITVGSFSIAPGTPFSNLAYSFPTILGPSYDIRLLATNTIGAGFGSVSLEANNRSSFAILDATAIPEPATFSLLVLGGAVLAFRRVTRA